MDRSEEEMKFVGFFGIFKQSFKLIFSWKKIFAQITLTLILPLTIVFLAHRELSHHLFRRIETDSLIDVNDFNDRRRTTVTAWLYYWLFKIAYFILLTVFSLLSTAAVVFTIASVYTGREVVYRKVLKVIPNVWKKLFVTFLYIYLALFIYDVIFGVALVIIRSIFGYSLVGSILILIIVIAYVLGFLYLSVVWQLASVVTVLEDSNGLKAMRKGKDLLNGKKKVGMGIAFVLYGLLVGLIVVYELFVEFGGDIFKLGVVWRVLIGILCCIMVLKLFLLFIVTQTVLYLVCKSHHGEAIDKVSLSTFLGAYMREPAMLPKAGEEIQLGRPTQHQPQSEQV